LARNQPGKQPDLSGPHNSWIVKKRLGLHVLAFGEAAH
jgi:hypothetical protein